MKNGGQIPWTAVTICEMTKTFWQTGNPKKIQKLYFLWQMVQQNYQEETTNSKNPLWDGNPSKRERERISAENLTAIGKSFNVKNQKMTQKLRKTGLFKKNFICRHHIDPRVKFTWQEKYHSLFHKIWIMERNSSERKYTIQEIREENDENPNEITSRS